MANEKKSDEATQQEMQDAAKYMVKMLDVRGYSVAQVKQGHLFLFKREKIEELLKKHPGAPVIQLLVEHKTIDDKSGN